MEKFFSLLPVCQVLAVAVAWFFPLAALGARFDFWHYRIAFTLLGGATLTALVLLAIAGVGILLAIARKHDKARHRAMLTILILLLPLSVLAWFGVKAGQVPQIHDISTDTGNPPVFQHLLDHRPADANPLNYTAEIAALQTAAYPEVKPLMLSVPLVDAVGRAARVAETLGWQVIDVDVERGMIEATDKSFWFGFVDDIVVRMTAVDGGVRVDVRSTSRVGRSDIGKNAQRIATFLKCLVQPDA